MDEQIKSSSNSSITKAKEEALPISTSSSWTILPPDRVEILDSSSASEETSAAEQRTEEAGPEAEEDERTNAE